MGGENDQDNILTIPYQGSSPHGRGKPTRWRGRLTSPGLIPAWAGKTDRRSRPAWAARTHPRMGGENGAASSCQAPRHGSSPHGRGKPVSEWAAKRRWRLIPARAGKTPEWIGRLVGRAAHPRAGGENAADKLHVLFLVGSSPRGRGKLFGARTGGRGGGLIPARAGKTSVFLRWRPHHWAHPRAGGENPVTLFRLSAYSGSSPRGRGKPELLGDRTAAPGLIPARAGKTFPATSQIRSQEAHPRAGGENNGARAPGSLATGSSPRGRGKRSALRRTRRSLTAHPRAGGENR